MTFSTKSQTENIYIRILMEVNQTNLRSICGTRFEGLFYIPNIFSLNGNHWKNYLNLRCYIIKSLPFQLWIQGVKILKRALCNFLFVILRGKKETVNWLKRVLPGPEVVWRKVMHQKAIYLQKLSITPSFLFCFFFKKHRG